MKSLFYLSLLFCNTVLISTLEPDKNIDYLILVNKKYKLPDDYESIVDLITVKNFIQKNRTFEIERKTFEYYTLLRDKLLEDYNIQIELDSVYRSVKRQQEIWDEFMEEYGEEYTKAHVAVPGHSEHHTGLAVDICLVVNGTIIDNNEEMIAQKEIFEKIHANLADYGFILRYPEGKKYITGYDYEPWHLRFVLVNNSIDIKNQGVTLEEYLHKDDERYTDEPTDNTDSTTDDGNSGYALDNKLIILLITILGLIL